MRRSVLQNPFAFVRLYASRTGHCQFDGGSKKFETASQRQVCLKLTIVTIVIVALLLDSLHELV